MVGEVVSQSQADGPLPATDSIGGTRGGAGGRLGPAYTTPLIELHGLDAGQCRILAKLELMGPTGSIKDRVAESMVLAAERAGRLRPGMAIVEGSSGNATIALGAVAKRRGYRVLAFLPRTISAEKLRAHAALGVEHRLFDPDPKNPFTNTRRDAARELAASEPERYCFLDQFDNPANVAVHERTTGREIVRQASDAGWTIDRYFAGAGTGGSLVGISRALMPAFPEMSVTLVDPEGSTLAARLRDEQPKERFQDAPDGIGERFIPGNLEPSIVTDVVTVTRPRALQQCAALTRASGLVAGPCTGYTLAAALDWCRVQTEPKTVLALVCDRGENYLSDPDFAAALGL